MASATASPTASPEESHNTASHRGLKAVVILLGALIVVAFLLLVIGLVTRFSSKGKPPAATAENTLTLPAGAHIVSSDVQGDRLILRVRTGTSDEVYILDTASGHLVARVRTAPPK